MSFKICAHSLIQTTAQLRAKVGGGVARSNASNVSDLTLNNQLSTINCFNEERHLSEMWVLALYERRIKREAKLVLKCDSTFQRVTQRMSDWDERHGRWVEITTWEECCSGRALREPARYNPHARPRSIRVQRVTLQTLIDNRILQVRAVVLSRQRQDLGSKLDCDRHACEGMTS
jgi:hypothetical protein